MLCYWEIVLSPATSQLALGVGISGASPSSEPSTMSADVTNIEPDVHHEAYMKQAPIAAR